MKFLALLLLTAIALSANAQDVCTLPKDTGMCKAYFPKWTYDHSTGECVKFVFGGCGGNGNKFDTKDECEIECTLS